MKQFRIAGHIYDGEPSFMNLGKDRVIGVAVPYDIDRETLFEIEDAPYLEVLDKHGEVIGKHRLISWHATESVYSNRQRFYGITWNTITPEFINEFQEKINSLQEENTMLTDAILEIAEIIGGEE